MLVVRAMLHIAQFYPQEEDVDTANIKAGRQGLWDKSRGSLSALGSDLFSPGGQKWGRRGRTAQPLSAGPVEGTRTNPKCTEEETPEPACHSDHKLITNYSSRSGERTFNVQLCFQPRRSVIVQCSTRRGLRGTKSRDTKGPPAPAASWAHTRSVPHTHTCRAHTHRTDTRTCTHG